MNDGPQVRVGGLQRAVVAGAGRHDARPAVMPAAARAGAHAAVPRRRRRRLARRATPLFVNGRTPGLCDRARCLRDIATTSLRHTYQMQCVFFIQ